MKHYRFLIDCTKKSSSNHVRYTYAKLISTQMTWHAYKICICICFRTKRMCLSISLVILFFCCFLYLWPSFHSILFLFFTPHSISHGRVFYPSLFSETHLHWWHLIPAVYCAILILYVDSYAKSVLVSKGWGRDYIEKPT